MSWLRCLGCVIVCNHSSAGTGDGQTETEELCMRLRLLCAVEWPVCVKERVAELAVLVLSQDGVRSQVTRVPCLLLCSPGRAEVAILCPDTVGLGGSPAKMGHHCAQPPALHRRSNAKLHPLRSRYTYANSACWQELGVCVCKQTDRTCIIT